MLSSGELPESKEGLSWWVLHVTTEDLRGPSRIDWATLSDAASVGTISRPEACGSGAHDNRGVESAVCIACA